MICIGAYLHKRSCCMTAMDATGQILNQGKVLNEASSLRGYLERWPKPPALAVESCSFWTAFAEAVEPLVERLVLVHPQRVKAMASARLNNDRVEAATVAARCSPAAQRYDQPPAQRKHRNMARVALARKLLGAVGALLRHGVCFDEQVFAAMSRQSPPARFSRCPARATLRWSGGVSHHPFVPSARREHE